SYTPLGDIKTITNALGDIIEYEYYKGGLIKSVKLPEGEKEEYKYDLNGNLIEKRMGEDLIVKYGYDELNQIINITNSKKGVRELTYNKEELETEVNNVKEMNGKIWI